MSPPTTAIAKDGDPDGHGLGDEGEHQQDHADVAGSLEGQGRDGERERGRCEEPLRLLALDRRTATETDPDR